MKYIKFDKAITSMVIVICLCLSTHLYAQTINEYSDTTIQHIEKKSVQVDYSGWTDNDSKSIVSGENLQKSFTTNLANTFFGRLSGLTVMQNGNEAGADSPVLRSRGMGTFGSGKDIYVLVDGFESPFEQLIPSEIESVVLLKDASATAIYGSRAANGVLLITTKRGKEGSLVVNLRTQQGFQKANRLPDFLGASDYATLYNEGLVNDGNPVLYSNEDIQQYQNGSDPYFHPDVDWYSEVLRNKSYISTTGIDFSGKIKNTSYFVLLNVVDSDGFLKKTGSLSEFSENSGFTKYNIRTNLDVDLSERLAVSFNLGFAVEDKLNPSALNTQSLFNLISKLPPNAFPVYNPNQSFGGNALYSNPLGNILESGYYESNSRYLQSNMRFTYQLDQLLQGLSASAAVSFNNYYSAISSKSRNYSRYSISKDESGNVVYTQFNEDTPLEGSDNDYEQWRNYATQASLNYSNRFGDHLINAVALLNYDSYTLSGNNLPYNHLGLSSKVTYTNKDKYIGELSIGYYGSENFKKGKQYGLFPAFSLGWIASKEDFLKDNSFINYLKLRGSYGMVGNDNIGGNRFMYDQIYTFYSAYYFGTTNSTERGIQDGTYANPNATWEKEKKLNIGFEARVAKSFDFSLDLFKNDRYDILTQPNLSVPQFLGVMLPYLNDGKVNNKGFELNFGYQSNPTKDLQFTINMGLWYAKNKIIFNSETLKEYEYLNRTGRPIGQPFLLEALGFFKDQADIDASAKQLFAEVQPGDIKYKDQNNDGVIDEQDYYPIGHSSTPDLTGTLNAGLKYRGFDLDVLFQGVTNRSVYLGSQFYAFQNDGKATSMALGRWTEETSESATYPRLSVQNDLNNYQSSSFWQKDGSFIKLRYVELGYSIPKIIIGKLNLQNARIFINGSNLFSLDHIKFADPETLTGYPSSSTYSMGVNIQF